MKDQKINLQMGRKGIRFGIVALIFLTVIIGMVLLLFNWTYFHFFEVSSQVQEATIQRHAYTFANVLLSSDKLVYNDGTHLLRGVFDKSKLDNIEKNPQILFNNLGYPASSYTINVQDLESNNKWTFSGNGPATTQKVASGATESQLTLPVVIRVNQNDFQIGQITLKITEHALS